MQNYEIVGVINGNKKVIKDGNGRLLFWKKLSHYNLRVFAWLKENPNIHIPEIIEYEEVDSGLIVVEEYVDGVTLEVLLKHDISMLERMDIFQQLLDGIESLHHAKPAIIHRDIKPSNIMIDNDRCVKIIDYDAAKLYNKDEPRDTVLLGTEESAAPEQYGFGASDARTDIYALGILIRKMFLDDLHMLEVADVCTQMDPENRYQSVNALRKALKNEKTDVQRVFLNIPGFRQKNPFHMIVASIAYVCILYICLDVTIDINGVVVTNLVYVIGYKVALLYMMLGWVDVFTCWTGMFEKFPFMQSNNKALRSIGVCIACICVLLIAVICIGFLQEITGVAR